MMPTRLEKGTTNLRLKMHFCLCLVLFAEMAPTLINCSVMRKAFALRSWQRFPSETVTHSSEVMLRVSIESFALVFYECWCDPCSCQPCRCFSLCTMRDSGLGGEELKSGVWPWLLFLAETLRSNSRELSHLETPLLPSPP
jgi:hypothetical protein